MKSGPAFRGAKIALINGPQIIAHQRDDKPGIPFPGLWDLPGGGREGDETAEACALREAEEEFGLTLDPACIIETTFYPAGSPDEPGSYFLVANITAEEIARIRFGSEGQRWTLMSLAEFMDHPEVISHFKVRVKSFLDRRAASRPAAPANRHVTRAMRPDLHVRPARIEDAEVACDVLRRSITELCHVDHGHDPAILDRWLANKTPDNVNAWITRSESTMLVAVSEGRIVSVGAVSDTGDITLNYVTPEARFRGVSRAMLAALEAQAHARGHRQCRLETTETAHRFYLANGYADDGPPQGIFGTRGSIPMVKTLPE